MQTIDTYEKYNIVSFRSVPIIAIDKSRRDTKAEFSDWIWKSIDWGKAKRTEDAQGRRRRWHEERHNRDLPLGTGQTREGRVESMYGTVWTEHICKTIVSSTQIVIN